MPLRVTFDSTAADAAYISLTEHDRDPGIRRTIPVTLPFGVEAQILLDFQNGRFVGIEVLGASTVLPEDLLAVAEEEISA